MAVPIFSLYSCVASLSNSLISSSSFPVTSSLSWSLSSVLLVSVLPPASPSFFSGSFSFSFSFPFSSFWCSVYRKSVNQLPQHDCSVPASKSSPSCILAQSFTNKKIWYSLPNTSRSLAKMVSRRVVGSLSSPILKGQLFSKWLK